MLYSRPRREAWSGHGNLAPSRQSYLENAVLTPGSHREPPMTPIYNREPDLTPDEFVDLLVRSTLAARRPVHDPDAIRLMLRYADLILTARIEGKLVGVSRALSDFAFCTYLSDLAVDEAYQRQGIGPRFGDPSRLERPGR